MTALFDALATHICRHADAVQTSHMLASLHGILDSLSLSHGCLPLQPSSYQCKEPNLVCDGTNRGPLIMASGPAMRLQAFFLPQS